MTIKEQYKVLPKILIYHLSKHKIGIFKLSSNKKYYYNPNTKSGIKFDISTLHGHDLKPIWYSLFNFIKL